MNRRPHSGMHSELLSWRKNKIEDHRLAQAKSSVDSHMLLKRKTHMQERDLLNRDITHNICRVTPTTDEYLGRTYHRYAAWRAREKERLDRRYRGLYKTYLKEYSSLNIKHAEMHTVRGSKSAYVRNKDKDAIPDVEKTTRVDDKANTDDKSGPNETTVTEPLTDKTETLSVENFSQDLYRRRLSDTFASLSAFHSSPNGRRCSTGSVALPKDVLEKLRKATLLPEVKEDGNKSTIAAPRSKPAYAADRRRSTGTTVIPKDALKKLAKAGYLSQVTEDAPSDAELERQTIHIPEAESQPTNIPETEGGNTGEETDLVPPINRPRRASMATTSGTGNAAAMMNRPRRASIAVASSTNNGAESLKRSRRGSLVPTVNNGLPHSQSNDDVPQMGKRLSRRPSMPTMAIPTTFN